MGTLSDQELQRATDILPYFEDTSVTWTLSSISSQGVLPPVVSLEWNNQMVDFSETTLSQLVPNGTGGVGTFQGNDAQKSGQPVGAPNDAFTQGSVLRYVRVFLLHVNITNIFYGRFPQWGLRTKCAKIPNGPTNMCVLRVFP